MTNELLLGNPIFLKKPGNVHLIISEPGKLLGSILFTDTACFLAMYIHGSLWLLCFSLYILAVLSVAFKNFFSICVQLLKQSEARTWMGISMKAVYAFSIMQTVLASLWFGSFIFYLYYSFFSSPCRHL